MATLHLEVISAERLVYSDDVSAVIAPGIDGELGILPHHAPLLTVLEPGELLIRKDGEETYVAVSGGFLEVMANHVVVLADAVERAEEIDEQRALEAIRRAEERLAGRQSDVDLALAVAAMRRAQTRLKIARRRRKDTPSLPGGS